MTTVLLSPMFSPYIRKGWFAMKFVVSKEELKRFLSHIQSVVPQKPSVPILSNFLIEAVDGSLTVTATDLVVAVRCHCPAKVLEEGATTLPAKHFGNLIREITAPNIEVATVGDELTEIRAGASRFKLHGMSRNEYPVLPDLSEAAKLKIPQGLLKDLLYRTAFAVSREEDRFALTGVFAKLSEGKVTFVGTDGKRLASSESSVSINSDVEGEYIIPIKAVEEVLKALDKDDDSEATLFFFDDKIAVEANQTLVVGKLVTGEYPDYKRVVPESGEIDLALHREELTSLLRQISLFTAEASHSVRFTFSDGELRLSANSSQYGEGKVSMPVNYTGDRLDIAFNPGFFLDILRHCRGETVNLELIDSYNPGRITDEEAKESLFVLMPMRLNEDS